MIIVSKSTESAFVYDFSLSSRKMDLLSEVSCGPLLCAGPWDRGKAGMEAQVVWKAVEGAGAVGTQGEADLMAQGWELSGSQGGLTGGSAS